MQTFDKWFDSQRDAVWGVVDVDLPEEKALRFARRVWDAATEAAANEVESISGWQGAREVAARIRGA